MPSLQVLDTSVFARALKDGNGDCSSIGLEHLKSLQKFGVRIQCQGASDAEVEEAEAELRCAINHHPNRPTFEIHRWFENKMSSSVKDQQEVREQCLIASFETQLLFLC
jgi:disease resistance protein RPM1